MTEYINEYRENANKLDDIDNAQLLDFKWLLRYVELHNESRHDYKVDHEFILASIYNGYNGCPLKDRFITYEDDGDRNEYDIQYEFKGQKRVDIFFVLKDATIKEFFNEILFRINALVRENKILNENNLDFYRMILLNILDR
jgi:hypothetical protein